MNWLSGVLPSHGIEAWLLAIGAALILAYGVKFGLRILIARLRPVALRSSRKWDDQTLDLVEDLRGWVVFFWLVYPLIGALEPNEKVIKTLHVIVVLATIWQFATWGFRALRTWRETSLKRRISEHASSAAALGLLYVFMQFILVAILVLMGLGELGFDIRALLAGLGIGGIAVALAAQNVLGDLLASLSIALDKPFVVGDYIVMGNDQGTVEDIGVKTTRVRSLSGEELIFSNKDLLESRIHNYKRMWERRAVLRFSVELETPPEKLGEISTWVKAIVGEQKTLRFDRCHLFQFGASSLDYELVFWVTSPDYNIYMDLQQIVLIETLKKLAVENINLAYPTQKNIGPVPPPEAVAMPLPSRGPGASEEVSNPL